MLFPIESAYNPRFAHPKRFLNIQLFTGVNSTKGVWGFEIPDNDFNPVLNELRLIDGRKVTAEMWEASGHTQTIDLHEKNKQEKAWLTGKHVVNEAGEKVWKTGRFCFCFLEAVHYWANKTSRKDLRKDSKGNDYTVTIKDKHPWNNGIRPADTLGRIEAVGYLGLLFDGEIHAITSHLAKISLSSTAQQDLINIIYDYIPEMGYVDWQKNRNGVRGWSPQMYWVPMQVKNELMGDRKNERGIQFGKYEGEDIAYDWEVKKAFRANHLSPRHMAYFRTSDAVRRKAQEDLPGALVWADSHYVNRYFRIRSTPNLLLNPLRSPAMISNHPPYAPNGSPTPKQPTNNAVNPDRKASNNTNAVSPPTPPPAVPPPAVPAPAVPAPASSENESGGETVDSSSNALSDASIETPRDWVSDVTVDMMINRKAKTWLPKYETALEKAPQSALTMIVGHVTKAHFEGSEPKRKELVKHITNWPEIQSMLNGDDTGSGLNIKQIIGVAYIASKHNATHDDFDTLIKPVE